MTPALTDADRAAMHKAIREAIEHERDNPTDPVLSWMEAKANAIYLAGLAAGMERAAKVLEAMPPTVYSRAECAAAIRAANGAP